MANTIVAPSLPFHVYPNTTGTYGKGVLAIATSCVHYGTVHTSFCRCILQSVFRGFVIATFNPSWFENRASQTESNL